MKQHKRLGCLLTSKAHTSTTIIAIIALLMTIGYGSLNGADTGGSQENSALNSPPQVNAGPGAILIWPNNSTTFNGYVTDDDPDNSGFLVYYWTKTYGPGTASITPYNSLTPTVSVSKPGQYTFTLTAVDDIGQVSSDTLILDVLTEPPAGGSGYPGDINGDFQVTMDDLILLSEQWLDPYGCASDPVNCADIYGTDGVNLGDFKILANNWLNKNTPIVITEILYNPDVKTELIEYVELYNQSILDIDLSGWSFDGITYTFPENTIIPGESYIIVAMSPSHIQMKFGLSSDKVFGPYEGRLDNESDKIVLYNENSDKIDKVEYQCGFPWPTTGDPISETLPGTGYSIQLAISTTDNDLSGNWRSATPTPAAANLDVYATNLPPLIRQVDHSPNSPESGEIVTVSAKVTDTDGVDSVLLNYQIVEPGQYISISDAAYETNWTSIEMHDDGLLGDEEAGDDTYTVELPTSLQVHRNLIRYRITVTDSSNQRLTVPYEDDPQPNFAYFVYDGVPSWTGSDQPGVTPYVTYPSDVMGSVPVYHLITKQSEAEGCTWYDHNMSNVFAYEGTFVYDGKVYDHIHYRTRGGDAWRYAMGKNMWKFDFNRSHYFQGRDNQGKKYDTKWDKVNLSACIQQGQYWHRGEQGMFEAVGFKMFEMLGLPSPVTNWIHYRIIDEASEDGTDQYSGDFWGLYLVIEQEDGRFLDNHDLPDGNLYKMESWTGELNNQGETAVTNKSDLNNFMNTYNSSPSIDWWRANLNLTDYYNYRCSVECIHHYDIGYGKNYFYYLNPETNQWSTIPWDLDLTWSDNMFGNGNEPFKEKVLYIPELNIEYENRMREVRDLLYNSDQMGMLLDEYANIIHDPCGLSIVDADRAKWDYHPIMISGYVNTNQAGHGRYYQGNPSAGIHIPEPGGFLGMVQKMKDYVVSRGTWIDNVIINDSAIPTKPVITYTGSDNYPVNVLTFQTTGFNDPQGTQTYAQTQWRIAEVAKNAVPDTPTEPPTQITLINEESTWRCYKGTQAPSSPDITAWREPDFNDNRTGWFDAQAPVGWGESTSFLNTLLEDMQYTYTSFFLRQSFTVTDPSVIESIALQMRYDDGFNMWINDVYVAGENMPSQEVAFDGLANGNHDSEMSWFNFTLPNPSTYLVQGENVIAIQAQNFNRTHSSDCFAQAILTAELIAADPCDPDPEEPEAAVEGTGIYEIDAVWQTSFADAGNVTIQIPAYTVKPGHTYRVRSRMIDNTNRASHWSDPVQFVATEPEQTPLLQGLRITELMYNPPEQAGSELNNDDFEYIELKNITDQTIDLTDVSFTEGIAFDFVNASITTMAPDDIILLVSNQDAFELRYPGLSSIIAGQYEGRLDNAGERIKLGDYWQGNIQDFKYKDGWHSLTDGDGYSLTIIEPTNPNMLSWSEEDAWAASTNPLGSPGQDDQVIPDHTIVINEVLSHSHAELDDWIELHNTSSNLNINIGGWYLSDNDDSDTTLKYYRIPDNTWLNAGEYIVFYEDTSFGLSTGMPNSVAFALSENGDEVYLSSAENGQLTGYRESVDFGASATGVSFGRYLRSDDDNTFVSMYEQTDGFENTGPLVGPIVINEIMYNPFSDDQAEEYIELKNVSDTAVKLYNDITSEPWKFTNGIEYTFPADTPITIQPGSIVILAADPTRFNQVYTSLPANAVVLGPFDDGKLSNGGEKLELSMPGDVNDLGERQYIRVDMVNYSDNLPWPVEADGDKGDGSSLQRINSDQFGNDVINWNAKAPTPGENN